MPLKLRYLLLLAIFGAFSLAVVVYFEVRTLSLIHTRDVLPVQIIPEEAVSTRTKRHCRFSSCFDLFKCRVNSEWKIKVYLYPNVIFQTPNGKKIFQGATDEFEAIMKAIKSSKFWTNRTNEACIFIPFVDMLSEASVLKGFAGKALSSLEHWNGGKNHLLFNFFQQKTSSANPLTVDTGEALIASGSFNPLNFRSKFDINIPVLNTMIDSNEYVLTEEKIMTLKPRKWLLTIPDGLAPKSIEDEFENILSSDDNKILHLSYCESPDFGYATNYRCSPSANHNYPNVLGDSDFCLIIPTRGLWKTFLSDSLMVGCIPVVMQGFLLPFSSVLDWKRAAIVINKNQFKHVTKLLQTYSNEQRIMLRHQMLFIWQNYFSSLSKISITTLEILNDRVIPHNMKSYADWNGPVRTFEKGHSYKESWPLFYVPLFPLNNQGFTAVILTYNRVQLLFQLMKQLCECPSLSKIIVVWNNPSKSPPKLSAWPKIQKPFVIIKSKDNKLSNRFYPYKEIETEAVLSIDDDISMLTATEVEFAFRVWRELPDRLVGFPGRYHLQSSTHNTETIQYQSEWSNDLSMVLTGVAFHHKLYSYMFTYKMPYAIKEYVDAKLNCEDIAMNFLISSLTRKAPIKVTARKRFICSECKSNDSLWSETSHFMKRTECLKVFTKQFGSLPLETVEYRADPVLFKENVPVEMQDYPDKGSI